MRPIELLRTAVQDFSDIPMWKAVQILEDLHRHRTGYTLLAKHIPRDTPPALCHALKLLDVKTLRREFEETLGPCHNPKKHTLEETIQWAKERVSRQDWPQSWRMEALMGRFTHEPPPKDKGGHCSLLVWDGATAVASLTLSFDLWVDEETSFLPIMPEAK